MVRVAINGFGRIGRTIFKSGIHDKDIEFVAINDLGDPENLAYLLKHDSVTRLFPDEVKVEGGYLIVGDKKIKLLSEKDPTNLPWKDLQIDVVCECTGIFTKKERAELHLKAGARKVILSAPPKTPGFKTLVRGVNEHEYDVNTHHLISNGSCTTNCLAPVAKVLNDNYGLKKGYAVTVHAMTADQRVVDTAHGKWRRGRAASQNIIPTSSGAAIAVGIVIPELEGKLHASAMRVPVINGSVIYLACQLDKHPTVAEVNDLFKNVSEHHLKDVLRYTSDEIVSSDIIGCCNSCVFDSKLTEIDGDLLKVVAWYDNEWGYSCRMVDMIKIVC